MATTTGRTSATGSPRSADLRIALQRATEQRDDSHACSYEELLPLGFAVYGLDPERIGRAPDPRWYNCNLYPFWYYSATAVSLGTTPVQWELDPHDSGQNLWQLLVLAKPGGSESHFHAQPPSDKALQRVFGPISNTTSPDEGGLGVSLARLVPQANWQFWDGVPRFRPTRDDCS